MMTLEKQFENLKKDKKRLNIIGKLIDFYEIDAKNVTTISELSRHHAAQRYFFSEMKKIDNGYYWENDK